MQEKQGKGVDRRNFLRAVGTSTAGAAAGAAGAVLVPSTANATESRADRIKKRYRETDHIKAFYRTNRY